MFTRERCSYDDRSEQTLLIYLGSNVATAHVPYQKGLFLLGGSLLPLNQREYQASVAICLFAER